MYVQFLLIYQNELSSNQHDGTPARPLSLPTRADEIFLCPSCIAYFFIFSGEHQRLSVIDVVLAWGGTVGLVRC